MTRRRWSAAGILAAALVISVLAILSATSNDSASIGGPQDSTSTVGPTSSPARTSTADVPTDVLTDTTEDLDGQDSTASSPSGTAPPPASLVTVPVDTVVEMPPVSLDDVGDFGNGLTVQVVEMESVPGEATGPGQVAGPAIRVTIEVTNTSDQTISLTSTMVHLSHGPDRTGVPLSGPGVVEFPDSLSAGDSATATVVFGVPLDRRNPIQVVVRDTVDAPIIAFEGAGPD